MTFKELSRSIFSKCRIILFFLLYPLLVFPKDQITIELNISQINYEPLGVIHRLVVKNNSDIDFHYKGDLTYKLYQNNKLIATSFFVNVYYNEKTELQIRTVKAHAIIAYHSKLDEKFGDLSLFGNSTNYFKKLRLFGFCLKKGDYEVCAFYEEKGTGKKISSPLVKFKVLEHSDKNERETLNKLNELQNQYNSGLVENKNYNDEIFNKLYVIWTEHKTSIYINTIGLNYLSTPLFISNAGMLSKILEMTNNSFNTNPIYTEMIIGNIKNKSDFKFQNEFNKEILNRAKFITIFSNSDSYNYLEENGNIEMLETITIIQN